MPKSPYTAKVSLNVEFNFESCNFMEVLLGFMRGMSGVFQDVLGQVQVHYAVIYKEEGKLHKLLGHTGKLTWKNLRGDKQTCLYTFGKVGRIYYRTSYGQLVA